MSGKLRDLGVFQLMTTWYLNRGVWISTSFHPVASVSAALVIHHTSQHSNDLDINVSVLLHLSMVEEGYCATHQKTIPTEERGTHTSGDF